MILARPHYSILLVDDDPIFLESLGIIFEPYPEEWKVMTVSNVTDAVNILSTHSFDLAIIDVNLGDGTAADVIREIGTIPCMLCSSDRKGRSFEKMFNDHTIMQNVVGFLNKPLSSGAIYPIRAAARVGETWKERNRLVAEATAQVEEERRVIAHNLHDEMGAYLMQLAWLFGSLETSVKNLVELTQETRKTINGIAEKGKGLLNSARVDLSKIVTQVRPEAVNVAGLRGGIEFLVGEWAETAAEVKFDLEIVGDLTTLDLRRAGVIYRIVQEGLTNAMRHAQPISIHVKLVANPSDLMIVVRSIGSILHDREHYQLTSLRERTSSLGGVLRFTCDQQNGQSLLQIVIPT